MTPDPSSFWVYAETVSGTLQDSTFVILDNMLVRKLDEIYTMAYKHKAKNEIFLQDVKHLKEGCLFHNSQHSTGQISRWSRIKKTRQEKTEHPTTTVRTKDENLNQRWGSIGWAAGEVILGFNYIVKTI